MSATDITLTSSDTKENKGDENAADTVVESTTKIIEIEKPINPINLEKEQEAKLRAKYAGLKGPGSNAFLQKRLSRGQKYFDSGDYNMAKAKIGVPGKKSVVPAQKLLLQTSTGEAIPTPEAIPHKKLMVQSKLISGGHAPC